MGAFTDCTARGEVVAALAGCALGFRSGTGAGVGAMGLRAACTCGGDVFALMLRVSILLAVVTLSRCFLVSMSGAEGGFNGESLGDASVCRNNI